MITSKCREVSRTRISQGFSMRQLAKKAGVNIATVSTIESHPKSVTPRVAKKISDALGVNMEDVFDFQFPAET